MGDLPVWVKRHVVSDVVIRNGRSVSTSDAHLDAGGSVRWGEYEFSIYADNVFNTQANLGDLRAESFPEHVVSATLHNISNYPIVVTNEPFRAGVQLRWHM